MTALHYDDISLVANYFDGDSRSDLDTSVQFGPQKFNLPVVPANMVCCVSEDIAIKLSSLGYFYILHRFMPKENLKEFVKKANTLDVKTISISLGVQSDDYEFIEWWGHGSNLRIDYITIDIAHGHCFKMKQMLDQIKTHVEHGPGRNPFIIAGNVMTQKAVDDLISWGANAVKIGVGGGKACTTKLQTGFHSPMFSTIKSCCSPELIKSNRERIEIEILNELRSMKHSHYDYVSGENIFNVGDWAEGKLLSTRAYDHISNTEKKNYIQCSNSFWIHTQSIHKEVDRRLSLIKKPLIVADGGIRYPGDIAKAIVAGADMVMVGSLFTACKDSPAENIYKIPDAPFEIVGKKYFGSASYHNGNKKNIEGTLVELECNGLTYIEFLSELKGHLQSSISYSGGNNLSDLKNCKYEISHLL